MSTESEFFRKMNQLDRVLSSHADSPAAFPEMGGLLTDDDVSREFFKRLQNPGWIPLLDEAGYFDTPPRAKHMEDGQVQYPGWAAAEYLVRMASQAPKQVATILARVRTDNAFVIGNIVDAALAMPPCVAVSLVPSICQAAREGSLWIDFKDASDLCVYLVEGAEFDAAMQLANALFAPVFEKGEEKPARRDAYWYKEGLRKVSPVLVVSNPQAFLPALCDWLKAAVEAKGRVNDKGRDYSDIWRPAIEEHEQNKDYDFASAVVGCVRDGFERAITSGNLSLDGALQIINDYQYLVFRRIRLHLIGAFAEQNPDLAQRTMLDRGLFEEYGCKHEHATLLGKRFGMLDSAQQATWLKWVQEIPTPRIAEVLTEPNDPDKSQCWRNYWRFERLHWVRDHLTGEHKHFYEKMLAECGEPDMADLNFRSGPVRWGDESPLAVEELSKRTFEEAVQMVCSWNAEGTAFMRGDIEGLASTFGQYVGTDPEQYSREAQLLIDRPAIFVRKFVEQMRGSVTAGREIDLSGVLTLCEWVLSRPVDERTTPEQERGFLVDKNWQWTRDEISGFLRSVCTAMQEGTPRYPFEGFREWIWRLIEPLCYDGPDPLDEDALHDDPRTRDYLNFAINTSRGKALEAACEYARCVANHVKERDEKKEVVPGGFGAMPEFRQMLEWQVARENRSTESMAIMGARISLIYWIDKEWLVENVCRLFPLQDMKETPVSAEAWAAWNAFLVWGGTHIEFYRILKPHFAYAVEQLVNVEPKGNGREEPMRRLGEHLMLLYGRGDLGLDEDGGLIRQFIANASADLRRHTISFVGQTLDGDTDIPSDVIQRFMTLWEEYWSGFGKQDAKEEPNAWLFGWWFSCGQFPEQWALVKLEEFVEVAPTPEPDHAIRKRLAEIAYVDIARSVRILNRMIRGDREGWRIHSCVDEARVILGQAMQAQGEARDTAVALIDYLGRQNYMEFGQLLRQ
jgi:hypothetical protein